MIKRQKANADKIALAAKAAASEDEEADAGADAGEIEMVENPDKQGEEAQSPDEEKATE